jgi:3-oxoacyl-[acyl-carrier-protein] synthase II
LQTNLHVQRRVVITGCGVLCAAGAELDDFWRSLTSGRSFIGPLTNFAYPGQDIPLGAEVTIPAEDTLSPDIDENPYRARCAQLALAASRRALAHAGLKPGDECLSRAGVVLGTTMGEERQIGDLSERRKKLATDSVDAGFLARADNHKLAAAIATRYGLGGPVLLNATACSSGNASVAWAYDMVCEGTTDLMLAGGADTFTRLIYCGFSRMSALSKTACKPFDKNRDGVSFGEGSGILVIEELENARKRGANILAEILGYGVSNDAYHVTAPEPNGTGFIRAIEQALRTAQTSPDQIGYVCAHGTGTQYNDQGEVRAIKTVFGERASRIPLSSIKAAIGHTNGASGAIATIACTLALVHQMVPPTATLVEPDPEFDMDFVMGQARATSFSTCLNMAAGFGGSNICLLITRAP